MPAAKRIFSPMRFKATPTTEFAALQGVISGSAITDAWHLKYLSSPTIVE
jgi:hypothetical protein